jgi:purine-binding chemotaxis protein CheW
MNLLSQFVVFRLGEQRYAISLAAVERIVPAVEITPLPKAPAIVLGVINVAGRIVPVLNLRRRFRLPEREVSPGDQFLIAQTSRQMVVVVVVVDEARGVIEVPDSEIFGSAQIMPGLEQIQGLIKLPDGLVLIHDLEKFLSLEETQDLVEAMNEEIPHGA